MSLTVLIITIPITPAALSISDGLESLFGRHLGRGEIENDVAAMCSSN